MSTPNVARIVYAPGTLVLDHTGNDLAPANYPYGGTILGKARGIYLVPMDGGFTIWSEEFGEPAEELQPLRDWLAGCVLRGFDDDVINLLFPNTGVGAVTRHSHFTIHGTVAPGQEMYSAKKHKLLFVPENPRDIPGFIAYAAIPRPQDGAQIVFARQEEPAFVTVWKLLRDATGKIGQLGRMWDLTP